MRTVFTTMLAKAERPRGLICEGEETYPKLSHVQCNVLIERIENDFADTLITPSTVN